MCRGYQVQIWKILLQKENLSPYKNVLTRFVGYTMLVQLVGCLTVDRMLLSLVTNYDIVQFTEVLAICWPFEDLYGMQAFR